MAVLEPMHEMMSDDTAFAVRSWFRQVLRQLVADPGALSGLVLLAGLIVLTMFAPLLAHYAPNAVDLSKLNQEPSGQHWFGTDYLGRDMWSRCLYGGRISLPAGVAVNIISFGLGVPLGLIAGYGAGILDDFIMRMMDLLLSFPGILLALGIVAILGPSLTSAIIAVGIGGIPYFARVARGSTLSVQARDYVTAARALGVGRSSILLRHVLPNIIDPLVVLATLNLGFAIIATAALSFLGVGTQLPSADWGTLLSQGYEHMFESWSEVAFPAIAIILSVLGVNLLGDGLSDAMNPHVRKAR